ncbi:unnamed protein product [Prunus armeniaca]
MSEISTLEISMISSGMSRYCACGTKIIRRTLWTDLNPGRGFDACDKNWEANKWSLVCLEDLEQWRRKVEQRKNN